MRVLHVILDLDERSGGPQHGLATLARAQVARGDDVVVLPCRLTGGRLTLPVGRTEGLQVCEPVTEASLLLRDHRLDHALGQAARGRDIVHVHGTWRYHSRAAARVSRDQGLPFVLRPCGNLGLLPRRHKRWLKLPYFYLLERPAANRASAIHCMSTKEQDEIAGLGLTPRVFVLPNPVESALLDLAPDRDGLASLCPGLHEGLKLIVFVGRVSFLKRLDVLVEAFLRMRGDCPDWGLVIAGPHESLDIVLDLRRRIGRGGGDERIWMPGLVRGAVKAALLRRAEIYAQPSDHENFGMSVAEALLFGTPCAVAEGVALGTSLEQAGAGIRCAAEAGAFESVLRRLAEDESLRRSLSAGALRLAETFTPGRVAENLAREYETCLNRSA